MLGGRFHGEVGIQNALVKLARRAQMGPADDLVGRSEDQIDEPPLMGSMIKLDQAIVVQAGAGE